VGFGCGSSVCACPWPWSVQKVRGVRGGGDQRWQQIRGGQPCGARVKPCT